VVSGTCEAIESFQHELEQQNIASTRLHTSHAFHSAMMEPALERFAAVAGQVKFHAPQIPYISNVTGSWIKTEEATNSNYWANHLRHTVRFADGLAELFKSSE